MHLDTRFVWPNLELPLVAEQGYCQGLRSHFGILVDGTVVPCCLDGEGVITLGNIQTNNLVSILNSARAKAIGNGFKQGFLAEELCKRCDYRMRFKKA